MEKSGISSQTKLGNRKLPRTHFNLHYSKVVQSIYMAETIAIAQSLWLMQLNWLLKETLMSPSIR